MIEEEQILISGKQLKAAIIHAAILITNNRRSVDELNVYPVPDGDTGTNMSMTISAAKRQLELLGDDVTVSEVADVTASAMLRGARGNSGVITSLLFRGFSKGLAGLTEASCKDFANALELGVAGAYKAVMKPTEGTILTVSRMAAVKAQELAKTNPDELTFWQGVLDEANSVLKQTTEMLPALKKANVVDAGGQGFCIIIGGMLASFRGEPLPEDQSETKSAAPDPSIDFNAAVAQYDDEINFTYCTEYIIEKNDASVDGAKLRAYLETIGDCVVVVEDDEIIKVHVHTDAPGLALTKALEFGHFINEPKPKIENMRIQHEGKVKEAKIVKQQGDVPVEPTKEFGFVAVAAGGGLERTFLDLGVDQVVKGGQTMNPSADDFIRAFDAANADNIVVFPNNGNIIMAANQASYLVQDKKVIVIPTKTVTQGISAVINYVPALSIEDNTHEMTEAAKEIRTCEITYAIRDTEIDGKQVHTGDYMGIGDGHMLAVGTERVQTAIDAVKAMVDEDSELLTIYYGADASEDEATEIADLLEEDDAFADIDIEVVYGGQPVYYYIISAE